MAEVHHQIMEAHKSEFPPIEQQKLGMEEKGDDERSLSQVSLFRPRLNRSSPKIKQRKPCETMKKLFEIEKTPWGFQFRPKDEEGQVLFPYKQSHPHSSPMVVSDKPRKSGRYKRKRTMIHEFYGQVEVTSSAMERAQDVQANLAAKFPSFVKPMIRSNVTGGFWLSLPRPFCNLHLPGHDATIVLVDETGEEYKTKYLVERRGLSGGWRGFSIAHKLVEEDVLVFHLVRLCKLKVYIVRANGLDEVDAALGLMHLDAHAKRMDSDHVQKDTRILKQAGGKRLRSLPLEVFQVNFQKNSQMVINTNDGLVTDWPGNNGTDLGLALEGLNSETTSIGSVVRACKLTLSPDDIAIWDKSLIAFDQLRINVGLIRARLDRLVYLAIESKVAVEYKSYRESGLERCHGEEMSTLEAKMLKFKDATERLYAEIEVLKINAEMHKLMYQ